MEALGGARGYNAIGAPATDGSVSILRRASDSAKPEEAKDAVAGVDGDDVAAETPPARPVGNVGQHLDLRL